MKILPSNAKLLEITVDVKEDTDPKEITGIGQKFWDIITKQQFLIVTEQDITNGKRFTYRLYVLKREE